MDNISFSGRAAFSYVWKKNSDSVRLSRLLTAIGAACIGLVCGYKVKCTDVDSYITQGGNEYFIREYEQKKTEINKRHIQKINMGNDIRYTTTPHSSIFFGNSFNDSYITEDVKSNTENEKSVRITVGKNTADSQTINYSYTKTETNQQAYTALSKALDMGSANGKPVPIENSYEEIHEKVNKKKSQLPRFEFIKGDCAKQHKYVDEHSGENKVIVLNASQINYQEQVDQDHDILKNTRAVYQDNTFGPATVRTEQYGVEFLAHTLIKSNDVEFSGAFFDFFTEKAAQYGNKLKAKGGYYNSNLTEKEWNELTTEFIASDKKTEGFRWGSNNGKTIYQTGAINSKIEGTNSYYDHLHQDASPPPTLQFFILFLQIRNALLKELENNEPIVVHTTSIGEGVFRNKKNLSFTALQAAIHSLPDDKKSNIKTVFFGSHSDTNACEVLGGTVIDLER